MSALEELILACLARRGKDSSVCPSEVARSYAKEKGRPWRHWMDAVRAAAAVLARDDRILITRGTSLLSPDELAGGPIRLRRGRRFPLPPND